MLLTACGALTMGCGDEVDQGSTPTSSQTQNTAPPPGPSAAGWQMAYAEGGVATDCASSAAEMLAAGVPRIEVEQTSLFVGFVQDGNNQNPILARFDAGEPIYCLHHETEGPDGRAVGLTWNGGDDAYVVYTVVGGGTALEGKGGWLSAYAPGAISGGGPKVSYVGRVDVASGALATGTFIIAVMSDNTVNSHSPAGPARMLEDGQVEFLGESAHKPIDADGASPMSCTDYPFSSRYRFSTDLTELECADCTNCEATQPCP